MYDLKKQTQKCTRKQSIQITWSERSANLSQPTPSPRPMSLNQLDVYILCAFRLFLGCEIAVCELWILLSIAHVFSKLSIIVFQCSYSLTVGVWVQKNPCLKLKVLTLCSILIMLILRWFQIIAICNYALWDTPKFHKVCTEQSLSTWKP